MEHLGVKELQRALIVASERIIDAEPTLTKVDAVIGDGDHGTGMKNGFTALKTQLTQETYLEVYDLLHASGLCLVKSMGGASGVLFGTLLIGGLDVVLDAQALTAASLTAFFDKSIAAIQKRGRSAPGDKTMVDALVPAVAAMKKALSKSSQIEDVLFAASNGAKEGAIQTKNMMPRTGRAKNFREKAVGYPDPGALSVSIIFEAFYDALQRV